MADLVPQLKKTLPAIVQDAGAAAEERVIEFFTAEIRNPNTREAYARAVRRFFRWAHKRGLNLSDIEPVYVAAYVEEDERAPATVKQNLAALRRLFDHLVTGQVLEANPAEPVRSPKLNADGGKTPALTAEEARELLDSIVAGRQGSPRKDLPQLRDRAIIGVMTYTFARVSAVTGLDVRDYFRAGHRWKIRLHEKGGQRRTVPVHHKAKEYLDAYIGEAGIGDDQETPLFQSLRGRTGVLTGRRLQPDNVLQMVKRRAEEAGFDPSQVSCHTFRATGITTYLENGGDLETAQHIAGHASANTTRIYDRRDDHVDQEEIERVRI
ncbi:tyrosine-type recombinase/integrase [Salinibacter ruber]|uniref:tyrosine-type recombinase/integrase n=1 Tax=Salinibacter ruber TaxID=146919 RepID=UPI0016090F4B|nr:tyrosine-type recombinase/integrase [Salinibacter ruber]MBB4059631.1 site-specific recombinase XerD [Salinibacter ruber]